jgi:hypothetical protein
MQTTARTTTSSARQPGTVRVLLVPADPTQPLEVISVANSARAISDALGGHLLDDTTIGALPGGRWFTFYLADVSVPTLPDNPRAAALAARLGLVDRDLQAQIAGPVIVAGIDPSSGNDIDVPHEVITAAAQTRLTGVTTPERP